MRLNSRSNIFKHRLNELMEYHGCTRCRNTEKPTRHSAEVFSIFIKLQKPYSIYTESQHRDSKLIVSPSRIEILKLFVLFFIISVAI